MRTSEVKLRGSSTGSRGPSDEGGAMGEGVAGNAGAAGAGGGLPSVATNSVPQAEHRIGTHPSVDGTGPWVRHTGQAATRPSAPARIGESKCAPWVVIPAWGA